MSYSVRLFVALGIFIYFVIIISMIRTKKLALRHALTWLFLGVCLIVFDVFPNVIFFTARILGIETPLNAILVLCVFVIFVTLISLTGVYSRQSDTIRKLAQEIALLDKKYRDN